MPKQRMSSKGFGNRLRSREFQLGCTVSSSDPAITEAMAGADLDFLMIDTEHSPVGPETVQTLVMAAAGSGTPVVVRVGGLEPVRLMQPLDVGADGVVVPRISTPDEVRSLIEHTRYPPQGLRGFGPRRAGGYGRRNLDYVAESGDRVAIIVQVETRGAVENLSEIAAIPGLDGLLVGLNDLSAALGKPGQTDSEPVRDVVHRVVQVCQANGIASGIAMGATVPNLERWERAGFTFMIAGGDVSFLVESIDNFIGKVRARFNAPS